MAGAGTSAAAHAYQFLDVDLAHYAAPQVYYRLRQVDTDGTNAYSPVCALAVPHVAALSVVVVPGGAGSPAEGLTLAVATDQPGPAIWLLTDGLGRVVRQQETALRIGTTTLLPIGLAGLAPGLYVVRVQQGQ